MGGGVRQVRRSLFDEPRGVGALSVAVVKEGGTVGVDYGKEGSDSEEVGEDVSGVVMLLDSA